MTPTTASMRGRGLASTSLVAILGCLMACAPGGDTRIELVPHGDITGAVPAAVLAGHPVRAVRTDWFGVESPAPAQPSTTMWPSVPAPATLRIDTAVPPVHVHVLRFGSGEEPDVIRCRWSTGGGPADPADCGYHVVIDEVVVYLPPIGAGTPAVVQAVWTTAESEVSASWAFRAARPSGTPRRLGH
ncbi:MAG: hypothetical protein ACT4RN_10310 [Pseudonocardia sp.]